MPRTTQPTKEQVRQYGELRRAQGGPPPSPERIREQLGWNMLKDERKQDKR